MCDDTQLQCYASHNGAEFPSVLHVCVESWESIDHGKLVSIIKSIMQEILADTVFGQQVVICILQAMSYLTCLVIKFPTTMCCRRAQIRTCLSASDSAFPEPLGPAVLSSLREMLCKR